MLFLIDFVNEWDEEGKIVFYKVCDGGFEWIVDLFLCNGVDSNVVDWVVCMFFFYLVVKYGYLVVVELFILNGVVIDVRNGCL